MSRPKVTLQNYEAVYDFYRQRRPKPVIARFAHFALGLAIAPNLKCAPGAKENIASHFNNDGRVILASNHVSAKDPVVLASVVQRKKFLHPMRGNVVIPAKPELFTDKPYSRARVPLFDNFVAIPTFRSKDDKLTGLPKQEAKDLRDQANEALIDLLIKHANEGRNVAIFPQGERKKAGDEGEIKAGIGRVALGINNPEQFLILPVGIRYDEVGPVRSLGDFMENRSAASVYIGNPFELDPSQEEVLAHTAQAIRECENMARRGTNGY